MRLFGDNVAWLGPAGLGMAWRGATRRNKARFMDS